MQTYTQASEFPFSKPRKCLPNISGGQLVAHTLPPTIATSTGASVPTTVPAFARMNCGAPDSAHNLESATGEGPLAPHRPPNPHMLASNRMLRRLTNQTWDNSSQVW